MTKLTYGEKFIYDWQYNQLSGFNQKLIELIAIADDENRQRLNRSFPLEVNAFEMFRMSPGWWEEVENKVRRAEQ